MKQTQGNQMRKKQIVLVAVLVMIISSIKVVGETSNPPAGDHDATYRKQAALEYPSSEKRAHHYGNTMLRMQIDETGHAVDIQVIDSSGYPKLDDSCVAWVRATLFWPRIVDGVPHKSPMAIPCHFAPAQG